MQLSNHKIRMQSIRWPAGSGETFAFDLARLDELHPVVSGNKIFKLRYNLATAAKEGKKGILTMGGAYSNHLAATAYACREAGLKSTGLVRGEIPAAGNPTLNFCKQQGMELIPIPRSGYHPNSPYVQELLQLFPSCHFIPEGAANAAGEAGCRNILPAMPDAATYSHIVCAIGTGTTLRGLAATALPHQTLVGIPVIRIRQEDQAAFLHSFSEKPGNGSVKILFQFAGKGYGRMETGLFAFMNKWYRVTGVPLDFVYTAKVMQAVAALFETSWFPSQSRVLVLHTGGLQGNLSLSPGTLIF
ncbi:MAG TPA: pyridoxal-phosphate dependent enzyme [Lacibacter sp.]|nr:pyridoxal-phosphate dependent enzyme [Lacibacter sp.]HMO89335.1 pyridoxal-phosphate dependent enzyme [Lacibacter sp.]HMP87779.1 pyridoxal-phosphate dependent enzyme [Lacibacter sp.]